MGPSFAVGIDRPRDRTALNHDPQFKALRAQVMDYLLVSARDKRRTPPERPPPGRPLVVLEVAR